MTKDEALKLALEALEISIPTTAGREAITALRQALKQQPADEPVALRETLNRFLADKGVYLSRESIDDFMQRLNTRPQPAVFIDLTDEEILEASRDHYNPHQRAEVSFARAIEAKLKEKNT